MAAALRVLRRRPSASPARILPSSLSGPFPKLSSAVAPSLPYSRGAQSSPTLAPSVLRRYCSARGGNTAAGLAAACRAHASPLQAPSLMPARVRHHGSTSTKAAAPYGVPALRPASQLRLFVLRRAYSSKQCSEKEAMKYALENLTDIGKSLTQVKRILWLKIALLGVFLYLFYSVFFRLNWQVAALGEKIAELENRQLFEKKLLEKSDSC